MRTPYRDGLIAVRLSKPETSNMEKTLARLQTIAIMQPIAPKLSAAAKATVEGLEAVLKIAGADAKEVLPLLDNQQETA
jgi:hypothetical protein